VVAFRVAGVPDVLTDGVTGYLIEPGDHGALAGRSLELLADPTLRRSFGAAAEQRCRSTFDIRGVAGRYAEVYAEVTRA
jgi:starch synthase